MERKVRALRAMLEQDPTLTATAEGESLGPNDSTW